MLHPAFNNGYLAALVAAMLLTPPAAALTTAGQTGEWRAYAADKASTKYSPLDQINADNVNDLQIVLAAVDDPR